MTTSVPSPAMGATCQCDLRVAFRTDFEITGMEIDTMTALYGPWFSTSIAFSVAFSPKESPFSSSRDRTIALRPMAIRLTRLR